MTDQELIAAIVVFCSLGGWYVVLNKYLELKAIVKSKNIQHIPGMGPPPLNPVPFTMPIEITNKNTPPKDPVKKTDPVIDLQKRLVCNWACLMHVSGLALVTGIPFLNIIVPTILWLLKKEQHPYLNRQGKEVINFQISLMLIQFMCLGLGTLFIWFAPVSAAALFAWTKTLRIVFATSMYLPFNLFTALPFFWGCMMTVRGAVAAYNGVTFKYPCSQAFIFEGQAETLTTPVMQRKEPQIGASKINFG